MGHLEDGDLQLSLFQDVETTGDKADNVIDEIRERFGEKSITRASLLLNNDKQSD